MTTLPKYGMAEDVLGPDYRPPGKPAGAPAPEEARSAPAAAKHVTFFLEREEYALPITQVREINRATEITRVPHLPEHVRGVINLRGRIVPVVDLRRRMGLASRGLDRQSRIVICELGARSVGLLVDRVAKVQDIEAKAVEPAPEDLAPAGRDWLLGVARVEERLIMMLDLEPALRERRTT